MLPIQLLPLLLRCLDLADAELKANVMDILLVVAEAEDPTAQEVVESHATTIAEALLRGIVRNGSGGGKESMSANNEVSILSSP